MYKLNPHHRSTFVAVAIVVLLATYGIPATAEGQNETGYYSGNEYRTTVTVYSPVKEESETESSSNGDGLTSAIEKSVDYLQKQIAPPSDSSTDANTGLFAGSKTQQKAIKTGATLTLVLSVFMSLVLIWRMRPGAKKTTRARKRVRSNQPIPESVVTVLGHLPFIHNQQLQLLRLGSRLLLVSVSANGSQTLGEINDPHEVREIELAFETGQFDDLADRLHSLDQPARASQEIRTPTGLSLGSRPRREAYSTSGRTLLEA